MKEHDLKITQERVKNTEHGAKFAYVQEKRAEVAETLGSGAQGSGVHGFGAREFLGLEFWDPKCRRTSLETDSAP